MDSDVCMHALNIVETDTGLWPRTGQNYDNHNVNRAVILYLTFHTNFTILILLNILLLGIVLPILTYWLLYSVLETPRGWCLGAEKRRSFQN